MEKLGKMCSFDSYFAVLMDTEQIVAETKQHFKLEEASPHASELLFGIAQANGYLTWEDIVGRINDIDFEAVPSLSPNDFRLLLPGFLMGSLVNLNDEANPILSYVFASFIAYMNPDYWDDSFIEKWCKFSRKQMNVLETYLEALSPHLGQLDTQRALLTLENVRVYVELSGRKSL